jgi:hypothetical protein
MRLSSVVIFATALGATLMAQDQKPQFRARELFYNPVPAKPAVKQETAPQPVVDPVNERSRKSTVNTPKKQEIKTPIASTGKSPVEHNAPAGDPNSGVKYQNVALSNSSTIPLAFRYTIQRRNSGGKFEDAAVDAVFRSGDRVRVSIESNDNAYLYIVQQGSRKTWNVLFPSSEINGGANQVKANAKITIPSEYSFSFDDQPGTENVYIVLSRKPETDFEKLIFALHDKNRQDPNAQPMPVNNQRQPASVAVQMASSRTNNPLLLQLESMKSRDLVFEKVDDENDRGTKEKAFYAGTPDTSANARVVARIELKHE